MQEKIDAEFIDKWEKAYDKLESDEEEYQSIIKIASSELRETKSIPKWTFERILNWKSQRLKGIVQLNKYSEDYKPVIDKCALEDNLRIKLNLLLSLYGIAVPTGTTILHFMLPHNVPIMDVRTTETLVHNGYLQHKSRTERNFWIFYDVIMRIKNDTNRPLRTIDRALFSYHKVMLSKMKGLPCAKSNYKIKDEPKVTIEKFIYEYHDMSVPEFMEYLASQYIENETQKNLFLSSGVWTKVRLNYIAGLILKGRGRETFSPKEIREVICEELIPSLSEIEDSQLSSLILTQDVHKDSNSKYNNGYYCLENVDRGQYRFIGLEKKH